MGSGRSMHEFMAFAAFALAVPSASLAQMVAVPVQSVGIPQAAMTTVPMLRQGTEVRSRPEQPLSPKTATVGERFELRSIEPVNVGSLLVIPAGSRAVGEVTRVEKKGGFGKSGKLDTRVLYVIVGDSRIGMTGKASDQGAGGTVGTVAAAVLFWPVMPFVTGKSADLPAGTTLAGYVENDIALAVAAAAPVMPTLVIPASAATQQPK